MSRESVELPRLPGNGRKERLTARSLPFCHATPMSRTTRRIALMAQNKCAMHRRCLPVLGLASSIWSADWTFSMTLRRAPLPRSPSVSCAVAPFPSCAIPAASLSGAIPGTEIRDIPGSSSLTSSAHAPPMIPNNTQLLTDLRVELPGELQRARAAT